MTQHNRLPLTSNHWGTYRARVAKGRVEELIGFEQDPDPSPIGAGIIDVQGDQTRVRAPMFRRSWLEQGPGNHGHLRGVDPYVEGHSRAAKIFGREPIRINPQDANTRELADAEIVRVYNHRGACLAGVIVDDQVRPSVVQMSTGAWFDPLDPADPGSLCKHGDPNVLTIDKGSSKLGQGPIAHSCLVEIERYVDPLPPLTAFDAPEILAENQSKSE